MSDGLMQVIKKLQEDNRSLRETNKKLYGYIEELKEKKSEKLTKAALAETLEVKRETLPITPEVLAKISHELRTPMNIILGMLSLATRESVSERVKGYLHSAQDSSYGLLEILRNLFDYFKLEIGAVETANIQFVLSDVLNTVIDSFRDQAIRKNLELILVVNENVPKVVIGDTLLIEQVLSHLVSNAVKFTEKGHIIIRVMKLKQVGSKEHIAFSVEDTGVGIEEDKIGGLFASFSRTETHKTHLYGGLGFGLGLCKKWVDLMGGSIWVKSEQEKGSNFFFTLELESVVSASEEEEDILTDEERDVIAGYKILLVDDNPIAGKAVLDLFSELSCCPTYIASTVKATEVIYEKAVQMDFFDIVIIDRDMPEMDGLIMARLMSSEQIFKNTSMVIMLNESSVGFLNEMQRNDCKYFLNKPIQRSDIFFLLKQIISDVEERSKVKKSTDTVNTIDDSRIKVISEEFTKISDEKKSAIAEKLLQLKDLVSMHEIEAESFLKTFVGELKFVPEISEKIKNIEKNLREFAFNSAEASIDMILIILSEASVLNEDKLEG